MQVPTPTAGCLWFESTVECGPLQKNAMQMACRPASSSSCPHVRQPRGLEFRFHKIFIFNIVAFNGGVLGQGKTWLWLYQLVHITIYSVPSPPSLIVHTQRRGSTNVNQLIGYQFKFQSNGVLSVWNTFHTFVTRGWVVNPPNCI